MLLQRPPGVRNLPKDEWRERIAHFQEGRWATLLQHVTRPTGTNQPRDDTEDLNRRAHRARHLIHHGELSAARQALTASSLAPGTPSTLAELRDPARRPPQPYQPLDPLIANYHPQEPVTLSTQIFTTSLCRARKGAAPGPSGLTAETLRLVLDDEEATNKLIQVTQQIARAELPDTASQALGLGRLVALQKPNGRVRGLVIGDLLRRLVARSLAQQFSQHIHQACSPHQYALSTRAGTEAVVHAITSATELDPNNTIVSVDGIGAYDTIARHSMLQALHAVPEAHRCLPFVRLFYAQPSTYVWHDGEGNAHRIIQAEGGEQGDPLMPALFSLGQHSALQHTQQQLQAGERLYAYLDDVYLIVPPHRVETTYRTLAHELQQHAHIQLNPAKTRVWNNSGHRPPNVEHLGPEEWVGARELPPEQQGITLLGTPLGTPEFQATHLQATADQHSTLLQRIPAIQDLQAEWLLLLYCASPRCNYLLRMLRPEITQPFAQAHDTAITLALAQLLDMRDLAPTALGIAHLPLHLGGLGLTSASLLSHSAYWASWADTLPILHRQDPTNTATILEHLHRRTAAVPSLQAITEAQQQLQHHGFNPPSWEELAAGRAAPPHLGPDQAHPTLGQGWQRHAAQSSHHSFRQELRNHLDPASQALLDSQSGPHASRAFTTIPFGPDTTYQPHIFRILLLRRLRLALPLSARRCRCRRILDPLGDHRSACAQAGVLRSRGVPLEKAAARVCREAGARVTTNTRLMDLNIDNIQRQDDRRIEVIANGLPLWGGVQLAIDTTLVSPLTRASEPRSRAGRYAGAAVQDARRAKERTYPELLQTRRCKLVVLAIEVGGRWSQEATTFLRLLAQAKARTIPARLKASFTNALIHRWSAQITHAAMTAYAASLLEFDCVASTVTDGNQPFTSEVLAEATLPPTASRVPARP